MPHKRNPVLAERLCGLARVLRGYLVAGLEDVALWHERDISHSSVERVVLPDASMLTLYMLREGHRSRRGAGRPPRPGLRTSPTGCSASSSASRCCSRWWRRADPGRRLPHRPARRPARLGGAAARSGQVLEEDEEVTLDRGRARRGLRPDRVRCATSTGSPTPSRSSRP